MPTKTVVDVDKGTVTTVEMSEKEINDKKESTESIADDVRQKRMNLLLNSDWTQGADTPTSIKSKWTDYRQKLRDVPTQSGFPLSVTWPTEPS